MTRTFFLLIFAAVLFTLSIMGCGTREEQEAGHFEKAKQFIAQGNYPEAVLELKNAIQLNPDNDEARLLLGDTYMEKGEALLSVQAYDAAVKRNPENMKAHLKLGQVFLVVENTLNARKAAKIILEKEPDNIDALLLLTAVQVQENNPVEAISTIQGAIAVHPEVMRARLFLANVFINTGNLEDAEQTYLNAISVSPTTPAPYIKLMRLYAVGGQDKKATDVLGIMLAQSHEYDPELMDLALLFEKKRMPEVAEKIHQHAVSTAPANTNKPLMSMGSYYARNGDKNQAMRFMQQAQKIDSADVNVLADIAKLHMSMGDIDAADFEVKRALEIDSEHVRSNFIKAVMALNKKDYVQAFDRLDFVIKNSPGNAMAYYYKAICLLENDTLTGTDTDLFRAAAGYSDDADAWVKGQAEENLLKAIKLNPGLQDAKMVLAKLYLQEQKIGNARLQLDGILDSSPDSEQALLLQGTLKLLEKNYSEAEAVCKKALENKPDSSQWLTRLGVVYLAMRQTEQAMDVFKRAIELNPLQFDALQLILGLNLSERRFDEALALCEKQKEKVKGNVSAEAIVDNIVGNIYLARGDRGMAANQYAEAVGKAPTFLSPRMALARLSVMEGRYDDAVSELEKVLKINEEYLPACMALGNIFYAQNDKKKAEKYYRTTLKIEAGYGLAANNLAYILSSYDNTLTEALSLAQTAVKKLPNDATVRDTLGWIHYRMGNSYRAYSEIEESLSLNPDYALANYHMGLLYYKDREFQKAREYLNIAIELDPEFEEAAAAREMLDM